MNAALRRRIVEAAYRAKAGHIPSALSIVDILEVLYGSVMRYRIEDPQWEGRDYFILSKGHGALALYAVLEKRGLVSLEEFCRHGSLLLEHPEMGTPGIEAATGSLGHGLPLAVGVALGLRLRGRDNRVFCLVGDGECNEGSVWEAAQLATHLGLGNLRCIVDNNGSSLLHGGDLQQKWLAFGWAVQHVDGHDCTALSKAWKSAILHYDGQIIEVVRNARGGLVRLDSSLPDTAPRCLVASTVKGKGIRAMEQAPGQWHHRVPTDGEYEAFMKELE